MLNPSTYYAIFKSNISSYQIPRKPLQIYNLSLIRLTPSMDLFHHFCILFFLIFQFQGCLCCLEAERMGLLQLKEASTMASPLLTWVHSNSTDCCLWERVKCQNTTGRVIGLTLNHTLAELLDGSLFLPFQELRFLDLSDNLITGFTRFSELRALENLNLEKNLFNNTVFPSLPQLPNLKKLNLGGNRLTGSLSQYYQVLTNLSNLEVLDLNSNQLHDFLPFHDLTNMSKMKILDLSSNNLSGNIPPSVLSLKSLEQLSIARNGLSNSLSGLCELENLQELDLSRNDFVGTLPACLSNMASLRVLDVSENQLSGNLPSSFISNLTTLEYISISDNQFEGATLFMSLVDHKSQFQFLGFSNCNLNISTNDLLNILYNQYNLRGIDLSHNNLHGDFPNWVVENNTGLEILTLRNNSLTGRIQFPLGQPTNLEWVDVSKNHLQGHLQTNIGHASPKLKNLNLSFNCVQGRLPTSLGNMKDLQYLDLAYNKFLGDIPESLGLGCKELRVIILCDNNLDGHIPPGLFNLTHLDTFHMRSNQLNGDIPSKIVGFFFLVTFDISQNQISGKVPAWVGNLTRLATFVIRNNSFTGPIPVELCNLFYLDYLDLSQNQLSGPIPSCLINLPSLNYLHLQRNNLTGPIPDVFQENSNFLTIHLAENSLSGSIPSSFGLLSNLRVLLLKNNHLSGVIPLELCRANKISILDLSSNMLSGSIPWCLSNITFGKFGVIEPLTFAQSRIGAARTSNIEYLYTNPFGTDGLGTVGHAIYIDKEEIEFMSKSRSDNYKGDILNFMAGMDLSSNHLTGEIPVDIGALTGLRAMNLSHNQISGRIPVTLPNLYQMESLDLSYNKLSGEIPSELVGIYTLAVFTVAYNNLSGRVPDMKAQFSTFEESSYEGNPFLCGRPLRNKCNTLTNTFVEMSEKHGIDANSFWKAFSVSYVTGFLGCLLALYVNPNWRWIWFSI